ncbi:zinc finger protein 182-like [Dendronephthya gigantea]|uniref:zinc finger protein 182-like n=1 Tax=Dendronephthya gigantea TaxID=151771 RepID=UPI00106D0E5A|nr:zinc finger protein 182-like [Dendronephthya gigantea]
MSNNTSSEELHKCRVCCKTFSRRTYLVLHEKIHGEKSYKCDICGKAFSQPAGLWIHKKHQSCLKRNSSSESRAETDEQGGKEKSSVEKRHECDICNKRFSQKHLLSYHMRTHTGENPYPCTTCGKTFRGAVTLKYHERTHTGQKPHTCIFCTKSFTQLGPLRAHCRKEHQSDRIYECDVCKEKFEKFLELSSHKKTHLETCTDSQCGDVGISNTERVNASIHVTNVCCQNLDKLKKIDQDSDPDAVKTPTSSKRDAPEPSSEINSKKRKRKVQAKSSPRRKIRLNKSVGEAVIRSYTEGENCPG